MNEQIENTDNLIEKTKELKKGLMQFEALGLDSELVKPSYVFDTGELEKLILKNMDNNPDATYHKDNYNHFLKVRHNIKNIVEGLINDNKKY